MTQERMRKSGEGGGRNSKEWLAGIFLSWNEFPETVDSTQGV